MKSAIFKIQSRADDAEGNSQFLQEAEIIFCRDPETGIGPDGYGWNIVRRLDDDYIELGITTDDAVMDMIMQDARFELVQKLDGWPEEDEQI
jgi:hypothetical protein